MFCKNCGKEVPEGSKICPNCMAPVEEVSENVNNTYQNVQGMQGNNNIPPQYQQNNGNPYANNQYGVNNGNNMYAGNQQSGCQQGGNIINPYAQNSQNQNNNSYSNNQYNVNERNNQYSNNQYGTNGNNVPPYMYNQNQNQYKVPETNGMAIAGFICAFLIPLLGWIFGGIGLKNSEEKGSGKGLSIAAIIISTANFVLGLILQLVTLSSL